MQIKHFSFLISFLFITCCFGQSKKTSDTVFFSIDKIESITYKTNSIRDSVVYYSKKSNKAATFIFKGIDSKGIWILYNNDGNKTMKYGVNNNLKEGEVTEYYKNGNLKWRSYYKKNKLEGESTHYYKNGKPQWVGLYKDGKMSGERLCYTEFGNLCDGLFVIYDEDGLVQREGTCKNGKPEGLVKQYGRGILVKTTNFKDGKPHGFTYHYSNQKIISTEIYKNGKFKKVVKGEAK